MPDEITPACILREVETGLWTTALVLCIRLQESLWSVTAVVQVVHQNPGNRKESLRIARNRSGFE